MFAEISDIMMVLLLGWTSVFQRVSLRILDTTGTRLRNVMLSCLLTAAIAALVLHDTVVVLLLVSLVKRLVIDIMDDQVQVRTTCLLHV